MYLSLPQIITIIITLSLIFPISVTSRDIQSENSALTGKRWLVQQPLLANGRGDTAMSTPPPGKRELGSGRNAMKMMKTRQLWMQESKMKNAPRIPSGPSQTCEACHPKHN